MNLPAEDKSHQTVQAKKKVAFVTKSTSSTIMDSSGDEEYSNIFSVKSRVWRLVLFILLSSAFEMYHGYGSTNKLGNPGETPAEAHRVFESDELSTASTYAYNDKIRSNDNHRAEHPEVKGVDKENVDLVLESDDLSIASTDVHNDEVKSDDSQFTEHPECEGVEL